MTNTNKYPININNIQIPQNSIPQFNQMDYLTNLNIQNNIQMYYLNKFNISMENCDLMSFQAVLTEIEHQGHMNILNKIKNILLNKAILLYLIHYNQGNSQYALKQMITLLLMKLKANPNLCLRYINGQNNINNINLNLNNLNNTYAIFPIVEKNDIELVKVFLDNNLDINIKDSQGRNCLFYLMTIPNQKDNLTDRKPLCSLLLSRGIKYNYIDNNGISPMMESINKGYYYIMNMLIKFGADVNIINPNDGNTALHYAIINKSQEALFTLLSKGNCDLSIKNNNNETAVDLAKKLDSVSNKEIYELIMQLSGTEKDKTEDENNKKEKHINPISSDNDNLFMFPPSKEDISSRIEFPFSFQADSILNNLNENEINSSNILNQQLHSLIKMENTPTLYIDISDEEHKNNIIYDGLKNDNENLGKTLEQKENTILKFKNENDMLKNELNMLKNELNQKNNHINILNAQKNKEENELIYKRQLNQNQIEQKDVAIQALLLNLKNLENELKQQDNKENINIDNINKINLIINNDINNNNINNNNNILINEKKEKENDNKIFKYLEKKFSDEKLTDNEVINLLTTDLYDFYHYNRMIYESRIQEINKMIILLKKMLDSESEIRLYGSYETKTSLIWSEVDILIIPGKEIINNYRTENNYYNNNTNSNNTFSQILFHKLKNIQLKVIYINDTQIISPIIKLETGEQPNNIIYNIFVLENDNNYIENLDDNSLLKSVKLSKEYINKYKEKYIPILLGIKQLLFSANLITNYYNINNVINMGNETYQIGISSYALNIMLMNFLDNYKTDSDDIPLGQIFVDFLKIYGYYMQENKKIIYLENYNNNQKDKIEEMNYLIENNNIDKLIIIDPFNVKNNLTKKIYSFTQLEIAFIVASSIIKDNCECSCHYDNNINYQGKIHCILNKIFKTVKRFNSIDTNLNL